MILSLAVVHFLFQMAGQTHPSVWTLYSKYRFDWTNSQIGLSLATVGLLSAFAQGWLTRILIPKMGEERAVFLASIGYVFAFCAFGFSTQGWMVYVVLVISSVFWISQPALQSLITKKCEGQDQGELQGSLVSITSLASILNPVVTTHLFARFTDPQSSLQIPGAPYFFAASMSFLAFLILLAAKRKTIRA